MPALKLPKLSQVAVTLHRTGILELRLNTPENLNSFGPEKYWELIEGFNYAEQDPAVKAVVVSSTGRYFSSGAALSADRMKSNRGPNNPAIAYIDMLIDFPKLAVCALQGPAYGIAVTTLPLFDLVYGSPEVTLTTPFSRIGISLEGCSSVTFPPLFGTSTTTRLLHLAETVPISELMHTGLWAKVLPKEGHAEAVVADVAAKLDDLAIGSIYASKSMCRSKDIKANLHKVNHAEMGLVHERTKSEEHREAILRFAEKSAAKKAAKAAAKEAAAKL